MNLTDFPHTRFNPLTGEWILVSPHRTQRPWQGDVSPDLNQGEKTYDPRCYLCPGNTRAGGTQNPVYRDTFVFTNDYSALLENVPGFSIDEGSLLKAKRERGICRVVCFSPVHNVRLSLMSRESIERVIDCLILEYRELASKPFINYIQIFENHGAMMGCSNPHPHCQIWANETMPVLPAKEDARQREYFRLRDACLLCDYIRLEVREKERIVFENDNFISLVPFWAVWPFETMLLPKEHLGGIDRMNPEQRRDLAEAMRLMGIKYDNIFSTDFPYSMGVHNMPVNGGENGHWHFHLHYAPPLLRSAAIRKFMVGYELMANPQRDITPEESAACLRAQPDEHYSKNT